MSYTRTSRPSYTRTGLRKSFIRTRMQNAQEVSGQAQSMTHAAAKSALEHGGYPVLMLAQAATGTRLAAPIDVGGLQREVGNKAVLGLLQKFIKPDHAAVPNAGLFGDAAGRDTPTSSESSQSARESRRPVHATEFTDSNPNSRSGLSGGALESHPALMPAPAANIGRTAQTTKSLQRSGSSKNETGGVQSHPARESSQIIWQAAEDGLRTPSTSLPFLDQIQESFGRHDVSNVGAHLGDEATRSAALMNARAFTVGRHVAFAGKPDLYLAAHEAAHVIQQGAGVHLSDGIGREGDPYERHADEVAKLVVEQRSSEELLDRGPVGSPSHSATNAEPADRPGVSRDTASKATEGQSERVSARSREAASPAPALQRAIGYEFELGFVNTYRQVGHGPEHRLEKGELLYPGSRDGFKITADDPPAGSKGGLTDLELIVEPPIDDRRPEGRERVRHVLTAMQDFINELRGFYVARGGGRVRTAVSIPATDFDGYESKYVYLPKEQALDAGTLQATAGIDYQALAKIRSGAAAESFQKETESGESGASAAERPRWLPTLFAQPAGGSDPKLFDTCLKAVSVLRTKTGEGLSPDEKAILAGVISVMVAIPINAWTEHLSGGVAPYPKSLASQLMARTDFGKIFAKMPWRVLYAVASYSGWVGLLLEIVNRSIEPPPKNLLTKASPIFPAGFEDKDIPRLELRLGHWFEWLHGLAPMDLLTEKNYPAELFPKTGKEQAKAVESLGAFGAKTDPGQDEDHPRPIFEFRSLGNVWTMELVKVGLGVWDYVTGAHR